MSYSFKNKSIHVSTVLGDKFIHGGILFKLTTDPLLPGRNPFYLYGGKHKEYDLAAKAAGHDLRGAEHVFESLDGTFDTEELHANCPGLLRLRAKYADSKGAPNTEQSIDTSAPDEFDYKLRVPMEVLVEFRGHTVTAQPLLDIESTVLYGNCNALTDHASWIVHVLCRIQ